MNFQNSNDRFFQKGVDEVLDNLEIKDVHIRLYVHDYYNIKYNPFSINTRKLTVEEFKRMESKIINIFHEAELQKVIRIRQGFLKKKYGIFYPLARRYYKWRYKDKWI